MLGRTFLLKKGVVLRGGFAGTESSPEERVDPTKVTKLSGDLSDADPNTPGNVYTVLTVREDVATSIVGMVDRVELRNGESTEPVIFPAEGSLGGGAYLYAPVDFQDCNFENNAADSGGGVAISSAVSSNFTTSFTNCIFRMNRADVSPVTGSGGGIYSLGAVVLDSCAFEMNSAKTLGGGAFLGSGTVVRNNCSFVSNNTLLTGDQASGFSGGGALNLFGTASIVDSTFQMNSTGNELNTIAGCPNGGAVSTGGTILDSLTIARCVFEDNTSALNAGAVAVGGFGTAIIEDCPFSNNLAIREIIGEIGGRGGAIASTNDGLVISRCVFDANRSSKLAGAVFVESGTTTIENSLFYGNASLRGGAIGVLSALGVFPKGSVTLLNSTIADNTATGAFGGGISAINYSTNTLSIVKIRNSIIWGNTVGGPSGGLSDQIDIDDTGLVTLDAGSSLIQDGESLTGIITADPQFEGPAANDYHLRQNTPARDDGDNAEVTYALDLDSGVRIIGTVDLGCYERCFADYTGDGVVDIFDLIEFQRLLSLASHRADLTADGVFDIFDVIEYEGLWSAGCP